MGIRIKVFSGLTLNTIPYPEPDRREEKPKGTQPETEVRFNHPEFLKMILQTSHSVHRNSPL